MKTLSDMQANSNAPFTTSHPHHLSSATVLQQLDSQSEGLTTIEAARRLELAGPNRLPSPPKDGPLKRFLRHFHDTLIYILLVAGAITALLEHWVDTGVILGVVVINALIGFIQEGKAEEALEGIRKMLSQQAQVQRGGQWVEVEAADLVPGDVVRLRSGDRVPADLRLIEVLNLRIEEAALTGESVPVEKATQSVEQDASVGDRRSMAYSGTLVTGGRGIGVVTATGIHTELGRINRLIADVEPLATPLTRQMASFGRILSVVIVALAAVMFLLGYLLHDYTLEELFFAAIGFAVAAIPEGLPAVLTITLALGVQRMAGRNAITRKLKAVETLGSVTVICSDKTGTLTLNEMTARHVVTRAGNYETEGTGYAPEGRIQVDGQVVKPDEHKDLTTLVQIMALCNDSDIVKRDGHWAVMGEPTEGALQTLARKAGLTRPEKGRRAVIPFESDNKFMATLNQLSDATVWILMKGAPDRLLDRSRTQLTTDEGSEPLDREFWEAQIERLSADGLRVLAAARRPAEEDQKTLEPVEIESDLEFVGLVGIIDPPRPEAITAIKTCRQAGIRVKMITGDHAGTAIAIAREMGIGDNQQVVTGSTLETASEAELRQIVMDCDVFARTSPEHKLRLVKALQAHGEVVAMTGDGVNDAPALKRADVGVAMGIKGTEATKEAADIVLADDNFSSIEHAVEEGRTIYDNLRKAIIFILPTNGAEALVILLAVLFGMVLPLTPVQVLWVNMVTAVTLALALAFEPADPDLMQRPPRPPGASILDGYFLWRIAFVSFLIGGATIGVFVAEIHFEVPLELARTVAVNTIAAGQVFYLFNCRYLYESSLRPARLMDNRVVWLAIGALAVFQTIFVYAPFMHSWFGTAPLDFRHWLIPLGIGIGVFLLVEAEKALMQYYRRRNG